MANTPPTGTITFLFTDIEGSTVLWENYPTRMPEVVERHDQILRENVEDHGGYVFKMVGDACCAAFSYPRGALKAALATQRALFAERWDGTISLRVRMALHTGFAEQERDGDYFGLAVNRVARVLSAGHGGQVLLSGATYNLVRDHPELIDEGARLTDLGEHRLKDLTHPERIHQLSVPDLPGVFPPLRADKAPDDFDERYRFKRFLGSGGMAKVYLAHDELLDRDVAIKVLHPRHVEEQEFVERFKREARSAAKLSHPNIVPIHDRGQKVDGTYWMVMEHLPGGTLKDLVLKEGPLSPRAALKLTLQVAEALEEAHEKGVIHRDIKPQNVLLTHRGNAKVADFGIARAASATTLTRTGGVMGTPQYIAPEQAEGHSASPKSDLYALGVILYEMLTQKLPYDADTPVAIIGKQLRGELNPPREINPEVPERVEAVALKLLARNPEDRYRNASVLVSDLKRVLRSLEDEEDSDGAVASSTPGGNGARKDSTPTILDDTEYSAAHVPAEDRVAEGDAAEPTVVEGSGTPPTVEVPPLIGKDAFQASATLAASGLTLGEQKEVPSETVPEGQIIVQVPLAGTEVGPDSLVSVAVSKGPATVRVPDLASLDRSEASRILAEVGLKLDDKIKTLNHETAEGQIIEQDPPAETEVKKGNSVHITVSSGPEKSFIAPYRSIYKGWSTRLRGQVKRLSLAVVVLLGLCLLAATNVPNAEEASQLIGVAAVGALVLGLYVWFYLRSIATVPDLRGKTVSEAAQTVGSDFEIGILLDVEATNEEPIGRIVRQTPNPNERDPSGSRISVVLSGGQEKVRVPDVSGLNSSQTAEALINAGLRPDYEVSFDRSGNPMTKFAMTVAATDPPAGSEVEPGELIHTKAVHLWQTLMRRYKGQYY